MSDLSKRHVLVTGASSGIGAALVLQLAQEKAAVAGMARRKSMLQDVVAGTSAIAVHGDVTDEDSVQAAVCNAVERLGGLDAVVNCAGLMLLGGVQSGNVADWRAMLDVNVLGPLIVTRACMPYFALAGGGDVINVGSAVGRRLPQGTGGIARGVYGGSKAALRIITDGLRSELRPLDVRVSLVCPGSVRTELGRGTRDDDLRNTMFERRRKIAVEAEDVARVIVNVLGQPADVNIPNLSIQSRYQE